jgi:carbonic anhydrase
MSTHIADACVFACMDFRFQKYIKNWLEKNMNGKTYDYVGFAGSTKDLKTVINQIDISIRLHHINQVVLIHHEDCGAYGKESTYDRHVKDLKKAQIVISAIYPDLKIDLFYLHLNGKFEEIK